jgi:hypothetical protein
MWKIIQVWLSRIVSALGTSVGLLGRAAAEVSWRKVLFVSILAGLLTAFGSVLLAFSASLGSAFSAVFPNASDGTLSGGTFFNIGVFSNFGIDKIFDLLFSTSAMSKLAFFLGLDWFYWAVSQLLLLWIAEYGIHRMMIWGGTLVRVAYDAL